MEQVDAFILIGGRSTRLGRDKAFVELGGMTLLDRAVHTVKAVSAFERVTVVAGNSMQLATQSVAAGVPFIFDLYENRGPLGGLHASLANARTPWIFVLACDYPFVSSDLIKLIAGKMSDEVGAVVPEQNDGRLQPLCAFYRVEIALPLVDEILGRPRVSPPMHEVVNDLSPRIVKFEEYSHVSRAADLFTNVNTAEELEHVRDNFQAPN